MSWRLAQVVLWSWLAFATVAIALPCSAGQPSQPQTPPLGATGATALLDRESLEEIARPDRFAWPARFTCHRVTGDPKPFSLVGRDPADMNRRLLAADVWPSDCRGGFSLRSVHPVEDKLDEIIGTVDGGD